MRIAAESVYGESALRTEFEDNLAKFEAALKGGEE